MNGKVVIDAQWVNQLQSDLDISQLQTGMYMIKLKLDHQTLTKRFIKQQVIYK